MSSGLVYSTDKGRLCPSCNRTKSDCTCKTATKNQITPTDGIVRLERQSKGRGGKPVVLIRGLPLNDQDLKALARKLKARCGVGGTVEPGLIIIQGDKREILKSELESCGYKVKIAGA